MAVAKVADDARAGADKCEAGSTEVTSGVETAMAGLSMLGQSASSSVPVEAANNSSPAGAAACPTNTLDSASAAAAATKYSGKKKKTAKKGTRKTKQESKCRELVLYDHQTIKCGRLLLQCSIVVCLLCDELLLVEKTGMYVMVTVTVF